jgi:hypothetical protein
VSTHQAELLLAPRERLPHTGSKLAEVWSPFEQDEFDAFFS